MRLAPILSIVIIQFIIYISDKMEKEKQEIDSNAYGQSAYLYSSSYLFDLKRIEAKAAYAKLEEERIRKFEDQLPLDISQNCSHLESQNEKNERVIDVNAQYVNNNKHIDVVNHEDLFTNKKKKGNKGNKTGPQLDKILAIQQEEVDKLINKLTSLKSLLNNCQKSHKKLKNTGLAQADKKIIMMILGEGKFDNPNSQVSLSQLINKIEISRKLQNQERKNNTLLSGKRNMDASMLYEGKSDIQEEDQQDCKSDNISKDKPKQKNNSRIQRIEYKQNKVPNSQMEKSSQPELQNYRLSRMCGSRNVCSIGIQSNSKSDAKTPQSLTRLTNQNKSKNRYAMTDSIEEDQLDYQSPSKQNIRQNLQADQYCYIKEFTMGDSKYLQLADKSKSEINSPHYNKIQSMKSNQLRYYKTEIHPFQKIMHQKNTSYNNKERKLERQCQYLQSKSEYQQDGYDESAQKDFQFREPEAFIHPQIGNFIETNPQDELAFKNQHDNYQRIKLQKVRSDKTQQTQQRKNQQYSKYNKISNQQPALQKEEQGETIIRKQTKTIIKQSNKKYSCCPSNNHIHSNLQLKFKSKEVNQDLSYNVAEVKSNSFTIYLNNNLQCEIQFQMIIKTRFAKKYCKVYLHSLGCITLQFNENQMYGRFYDKLMVFAQRNNCQ